MNAEGKAAGKDRFVEGFGCRNCGNIVHGEYGSNKIEQNNAA